MTWERNSRRRGCLHYIGRAQVAEVLEATNGVQAAFESLRQRG